MLTNKLSRRLAAEFLGTLVVVFASCCPAMLYERFPGMFPGMMFFGLAPGFAVAIMIYTFGHISGAHFNPAVTLAFGVAKRFPMTQVMPYMLLQFAGALSAVIILTLIMPPGKTFGATVPHVPLEQALMWETLLTFILMIVIMSVATDARAIGITAGMVIGMTVTMNIWLGGALSGASMNPARSLAPALWQQSALPYLWLHIVGPCVGAVGAVFVYDWIRGTPTMQAK
jgi:aquaporin NIP